MPALSAGRSWRGTITMTFSVRSLPKRRWKVELPEGAATTRHSGEEGTNVEERMPAARENGFGVTAGNFVRHISRVHSVQYQS